MVINIKALIKKLEEKRQSKVIVYCTGDRQNAAAQIGEDAVRVIYEHLLNIGKTKRIDLFIYSRGGDVSVPWRISCMIREFCEEFSVIVPYKAHSAATLISIGADNIVMGPKAELGPVDPSLNVKGSGPETMPISVEDVKSYLSFVKKRAGISDQMALSQNVAIITEKLNPLVIGQIERIDNHIRHVARKLITSRNEKLEESKINSIVEILTEKIYNHGHAIGRKEAKDIGLPIENPDTEMEKLIWDIYLFYEEKLKLLHPFNPDTELGENETKTVNLLLALIESKDMLFDFEYTIELRKKREIPPNPQINLNVNLGLPPNVREEELTQQEREILQGFLNDINREIPNIVYDNLIKQSPVIGIETKIVNEGWVKK